MDQELLDQLHHGSFPLSYVPLPDSAAEPFYRAALDSKVLFSAGSERGTNPYWVSVDRTNPASMGAERWGVSLLSLGVLVLYCWLAYRYRKAIATSSKALWSLEETFMVFDHMPYEFHRFFSFSRLLLLSSISLFLVLLSALLLSDPVSGGQTLWWWGVALLYVYGSLGLQRLLLWLVARFDAMPERLLMLGNLSRLHWAVVAAFFPLVVVLVVGYWSLWPVAVGLFGVAVLVYWVRLFLYFKQTGFSILQWFLYLCTLEVLPYTLFFGLGRTFGLFH